MGLENRIIYDLCDVAEGRCRLNQALIKDKRFDELYMLPAAQTKDKNAVSPEQVKDIILELKKEFEYVIIDCPAGIEQGFKNAIAGADKAIVVTTPENAAVRDADRIIGLLESSQVESPKLILNRIRPNMVKSGDMLDIEDVLQVLNIDLIGIVPDDEMVIKAANSGAYGDESSSQAAIAYRNIARRILGDTVPLMQIHQKQGMFTRFKKFFGM